MDARLEKRDILEVIEELVPGIDLEYKNSATGPYYLAKCPLHDDHKPSFVVYPNIQRCYCFSCTPQGLDVIDFVKAYNQCNFEAACKVACTEVSEDTLVKKLLGNAMTQTQEIDTVLIAYRLKKLVTKLPSSEWLKLLAKVTTCMETGKLVLLNQLILKHESQ